MKDTTRVFLIAMGLDPDDLDAAAEVLVEKLRRRGGRDQSWTGEKLTRLAGDFIQEAQTRPGNDSEIARRLARRPSYKGLSYQTLRRKLHDARDPAKNDLLARMRVAIGLPAIPTSDIVDIFKDRKGRLHFVERKPIRSS